MNIYLKDRERRALVDISDEFLGLSVVKTVWSWLMWSLNIVLRYSIVGVFFSTPKVFSGSMTPTLETNDFVLVSSCAYNLKLPFTNIHIANISTPQRGDVVAFYAMNHYSENADPSKNMVFTKRVVAGPGDRVKVTGGIITLNGKPVTLQFIKHYSYMENNKTFKGYLYLEKFPNEKNGHFVFYTRPFNSSYEDNTEEFQLGPKEYFCMGDNRNNSADSRYLIGIIQQDKILGKALITLISNGNITTLGIRDLIAGLKWYRFLTWIV